MSSIFAGTFIDRRDKNEYRTVRIGNRTWFAENLRYLSVNLPGVYTVSVSTPCKMCTCVYYTYSSALSAIPDGCKMPSIDDMTALIKYIGTNGIGDSGNSLKSKTGWSSVEKNDDPLGFSAEPLGHYTPRITLARRNNYTHFMHKMTLTEGESAQFWIHLNNTGLIGEDKYPLASYMVIPSDMYNESMLTTNPGYVSLHCDTCWADVAIPVRPIVSD